MSAEDRAEAIACRKCGADADQPCRTPSGHRTEAHLPRRRAYRRRRDAAGDDVTTPAEDSPLLRAARAERDARDERDRPR